MAIIFSIGGVTTVSISLPTIQREMGLQEEQLQWIVSAYPLSSGCLLLMCGRLADLYGRKKTFLIGSFIMAAFNLGCGFAQNVITLDILRGLQGVGAAAVVPASLGILANSFPPSRARSLAFASFSAGAPIGAVFGTALGGVLSEFSKPTWRSGQFLLTGLTSLCFIAGLFSIDADEPSTETDRRVDWIGSALVSIGLILIVFVLSQGEIASQKWATSYIIALLVVGIVFVALFLGWQYFLEGVQRRTDSTRTSVTAEEEFKQDLKSSSPEPKAASYPTSTSKSKSRWTPPPLMKLTLWTRANGRFAAMLVLAFTNWCGFIAWTFWVGLYYQNYMRFTATQTVVRLLPTFVSGLSCNMFVGIMAARVPVVWLCAGGAFATTIASLLFAIIDPQATYWAHAFPSSILAVMGADLVFSAGTLFIAKFSLPHEQSVSGALFNTMTQLGTAVGVTVTTVVYNSVTSKRGVVHRGQDIEPYRAAFWTAFAFGVVATALGIFFFRGVGVVGTRKVEAVRTESGTGTSTRDEEDEKSEKEQV
ncbi:major facilitator superfamily domain-containing protein [Panaeolus papilionaceus]|nr:major facilitator superfamily domain-containing protein [Panaeolus papilionaceus]